MSRFKNNTVMAVAIVGAFAAVQAAPVTAQATTLLDLLRGGPAKGENNRSRDRGIQPLFGGSRNVSGIQAAIDDSDPEPLPRVSGPRYYDYKAEAMRLVKTAGFWTAPEPVAAVENVSASGADMTSTASIAAQPNSDPRAAMDGVKVYATDDVADAVEAYYTSGKPLIWVDGQGPSDKAKAMIEALAAADTVGLDPEDYRVSMPATADATSDVDGRDAALMRFEVALSTKVLTYVRDTERGRIDPNKLSGYHDFKLKKVNLTPVLNMMRLSPDVAAYLRHRDPSNPQFEALKAELAKLREQDAGAGPRITIAPKLLLKPGRSDAELANVVALIRKNASPELKAENSAVLAAYTDTPEYTPELVSLVEGFQKEAGLRPDGVIGPATVRALVGHTSADKIEKLIVAMEQLRWLPDNLGERYVFINQPAFQAYYFDHGKQQIAMRVVVGSKAHQTYFFEDKIQTVEVNPYWGVPQSIIINEMLPKLRADPSYLDRQGYEVSYKGRQVSSTQVDWNSTHAVDVRQPPGGSNALGELKILFPNSHAIYMHDTPQKAFFKRDMRALSHGCVRLSEPRVMAAAVMGTTVDDIGREIAQGQNKSLPVKGDIPVYVSYFTAWPQKDGSIGYYNDVYDRDSHTEKAFEVTTDAREARS